MAADTELLPTVRDFEAAIDRCVERLRRAAALPQGFEREVLLREATRECGTGRTLIAELARTELVSSGEKLANATRRLSAVERLEAMIREVSAPLEPET